jgi:hypothetical protein
MFLTKVKRPFLYFGQLMKERSLPFIFENSKLLAPMLGLNDPHTFQEKSMKFAYEKIRGFSQYKGLREYKEKFVTLWINKYLVYDHDYDLIQIPGALMKVIRP